MVDLSQFQETYLTESFELLDEMEAQLMELDDAQPDPEALNAIFRCAHSIKGGGGAFGLEEIVSFTHVLEALLEKMRGGELATNRDMIDTLLASVDVTRDMLGCVNSNTPIHSPNAEAVQTKLIAFGEQEEGAAVNSASENNCPAQNTQTEKESTTQHYRIHFAPSPTLFHSGNDPLLLIRELSELGELKTTLTKDKLPPLEEVDPELCYLAWAFELTTAADEADIREIFEFVADECRLEIEQVLPVEQGNEDEFDEAGGLFDDAIAAIEAARRKNKPSDLEGSVPGKASKAAAETITSTGKQTAQSIRVDIEKIDRLVNMVGEIVISQAMIMMQVDKLPPDEHRELIQGAYNLAQYTRDLQESVMAVRMQPVKSVFSRMNRLVRDLSRDLNKDIRLDMSGEQTEIDKTVIEQLTDPLTHMIRNSMDHGLESPEERKAVGKPAQGTLTLSAAQRGGRMIIEIADDGRGINREKVLQKALQNGLITNDASLTDEEIDQLIFRPGFSTAEKVTNLSGRGVGMDVVRRNIEALGGIVTLKSTPGEGSHFTVSLPLTLAILDGMVVRVGEEYYVLPIANIIQTIRPEPGAVKSIAGGAEVVNIRGEYVPLVYIQHIFDITGAATTPANGLVILAESGQEQIGLVVDEMVNQQQVVIKSIEANADPVPGISGATILGDGRVSLILDVSKLAHIHHKDSHSPQPVAA